MTISLRQVFFTDMIRLERLDPRTDIFKKDTRKEEIYLFILAAPVTVPYLGHVLDFGHTSMDYNLPVDGLIFLLS